MFRMNFFIKTVNILLFFRGSYTLRNKVLHFAEPYPIWLDEFNLYRSTIRSKSRSYHINTYILTCRMSFMYSWILRNIPNNWVSFYIVFYIENHSRLKCFVMPVIYLKSFQHIQPIKFEPPHILTRKCTKIKLIMIIC